MDIALLTHNQRQALQLFESHERVTVGLACKKLPVTRPTIKQVFYRLVKLGYLERHGVQKGTYYSRRTEDKVTDEYGNELVTVFKGTEAFQRFFRLLQNELKPGDFYWSLAFKNEYYNPEISQFLVDFHTQITTKGVEDKTLAHEEVKSKIALIYRSVPDLQIKATMQEIPTGMSITKDRVATLVWDEHPVIIQITNPVVVARYQAFFESTWSKAFTVTKPPQI